MSSTIEANGSDNEQDTRNDASMICMSVVEDGSSIAFCAFNEEKNTILIEESTASSAHEMAERMVAYVNPSLLLLTNKMMANEQLLEALTTPPIGSDEQEDASPGDAQGGVFANRTIRYHTMKNSAFDVKQCKALILKLHVQSLSKQANAQQGRDEGRNFPLDNSTPSFRISSYHALASIVNFESKAQVQALGSLLSFLETTIFRLHESGRIAVHDIIRAEASLHMAVPKDTLSALCIFATEHHPLAAAKGSHNSKEGVSLFSLLDRTQSRSGRQRLREWMLKPLMDLGEINQRQDGVELFMQLEMQEASRTLVSLLAQVGTVDQIISRIEKCCSKPRDFLVLIKSLTAAAAIINTLEQDILWKLQPPNEYEQGLRVDARTERSMEYVGSILEQCQHASVQNVLERAVAVVDENATIQNEKVVVRAGFHPPLDQWKERYRDLGDTLQDMVQILNNNYPHLKRFMSALFMPQLGFLVAVKHDPLWEQQDESIPEDFTFICTEDDRSYFKDTNMRQLDESVGDIDSYIKDHEALIVTELEEAILDSETDLRDTFSALASLDCIISFAMVALDRKYSRPVVVPAEQMCMRIKNGRHPLQEVILDTQFIPNDANIDMNDRLNIVTGPNFSGKSCYARQIGIFAYMAQLGSFLPCDMAQIAVSDQLLVRFSASETCAVPQSSFQLDLTQMGNILRRATRNSLVIVDEFGKGTSPASGVALLTAALRSLSQKGCKVLCTTHFLEMFTMNLLDDIDGIRGLRMAVHIPDDADQQAVPLFTLERSVAFSSAGLACAQMAGVKRSVIDRAKEIVEASQQRRRVQPLTEILRGSLSLAPDRKELIPDLLETDWKSAPDNVVHDFVSRAIQT